MSKELVYINEMYAELNNSEKWHINKSTIMELVEREKNGIYISNEKSTELLEALEEIKHYNGLQLNDTKQQAYDKLKQALGGNNE